MRIRVGIVDDHSLVRQGLRAVLSMHGDLEVTGDACSGDEALDLVQRDAVDVLVMDLAMPGKGGAATLASIREAKPGFPVLIFSGFPEERFASTLLKQGASGYLSKDCEAEELARAIRLVGAGRRYISPCVGDLLASELQQKKPGEAPHASLSKREHDVFLRLAGGQTVGAIAQDMNLSVKTISTYRTRCLEKMRMSSNSELTCYAVQNALIA